jgi:vacuolar protein-sorting-associated protein 4
MSALTRAADDMKRAIELEKGGNVDDALKCALDAARALVDAQKDTGYLAALTPDARTALAQRSSQYVDYCEQLQKRCKGSASFPSRISERMGEMAAVAWDDVIGLEEAKGALEDAVLPPLLFPQLFKPLGDLEPPAGILLYGPPGTGKTFLARATATHAQCSFYTLRASDIFHTLLGQSEHAVRDFFAEVRKHAPAIVFIDEADAFFSKRSDNEHDSTRRVKNEILQEMSACDAPADPTKRVLIVAATNRPQDFDIAFARRVPIKIYIPLPSPEDRVLFFRRLLRRAFTPQEYNDFAERTQGYSSDEIKCACRAAYNQLLIKIRDATHFLKRADGTIVPCAPFTDGSFELSQEELKSEPLRQMLRLPDLSYSDVLRGIEAIAPQAKSEILRELEQYKNAE